MTRVSARATTPPPARQGAPRRIAALYDIHGNLPALEAVLRIVAEARPDAIVIGGDVVLGPMPREVLELLLALPTPTHWIRGNCDRLVVDAFDGRVADRLPESVRATIAWTAAQLDRAHRDFLAKLPLGVALDAGTLGEVLFCHATPRIDDEVFTVRTQDAHIVPMLAGTPQATIVCGHTHMPFDRQVGRWRLLNAGSVGMPYGAPGAQWLLLGDTVSPIRTAYDLAGAARRIGATKYPGAADFARQHVVHPPSVETMLRLLEPGAR